MAIAVGVVLAGAVLATLLWFPWGFVAIVAAALSLAAMEIALALRRLGMAAATLPIVVGTLVLVIGAYVEAHQRHGVSTNTFTLSTLALTVLVSLAWRMPRGPQGFVKDAAASLFIIGYVPFLGSFLSLLLAGEQGVLRVLTMIAIVVMNDTGGYVAGVTLGKHPMAPRVSPKKTWEGFGGSVVFGVLTGVALAVWALHVPFWVGVVLGVTLVAAGTGGDLVESLIKRDVGIKDMSSILPGHGGVMDRIDSMLVAAPFAWLVMYLLVPGG